jgi:hypothetical protein
MRLYGMYYTCKKHIEYVKNMKVTNKTTAREATWSIKSWAERSKVLNELAKMKPLRTPAREVYEAIPVVYRDQDEFDISGTVKDRFVAARGKLIVAMETVIDMYETINPKKVIDEDYGFDIKMPEFDDLGEFSKCMEDLDFVMKQCPYLNDKDGQIKYGSIDVGSTWLTFIIVGVGATTIMTNLAKIVDIAIKIKSHITTVKMQEEALRSVEIRDEIAAEVLDAYKKANRILTQNSVAELEQELGELKDGEEKDKAGKALEKLGYWMDKGMQIYSSIDAPVEIKDVFPLQQETNFLSDDLIKLLENKEK